MVVSGATVSKKMHLLRAFAVYCVVLAHSCYPSVWNDLGVYLFERVACVGVVIFFFSSGYYFKKEKTGALALKLLKRIVILWLFCGTVVYALSVTKGLDLSFKTYANYIVGNGSSFYYCTVYIIMRFFFNALPMKNRTSKTVLSSILIIINIISLELTAFGLLPGHANEGKWFFEHISPHMNPLNWIGFVALGILFREYGIIEKLVKAKVVFKVITVLICLAVLGVGMLDSYFGYFGKLSMFCEIAIIIIALIVVFLIPECGVDKYLLKTAENSLPIYLIHYPLLSLLCHGEILTKSILAAILRPIVCIAIILVLIKLAEFILSKLKIEKVMYILLGTKPSVKRTVNTKD